MAAQTFAAAIVTFVCTIQHLAVDAFGGEMIWTGRQLLNSTEPEPDKTIFDEIKEFYANKDNFAMYLVLPLIVLVYGGCSVIYCIAKCRQYFKKKKKKSGLPHQEDDDEVDNDDIQSVNNAPTAVEGAGRATSKARSASDVRVGVEREDHTPLPWQVPDKDTDVLCPEKTDAKEAKPNASSVMNRSPPPPYGDVEEISMGAAAPIPRKQPVISSVSNRGNDMAYNNAKYAAMLLHLDEQNRNARTGYKKGNRRMVFIAE